MSPLEFEAIKFLVNVITFTLVIGKDLLVT